MLNKSTFLNKDEVAELFGITQQTVGSWMESGVLIEGQHWTKLDNRLYFNKAAVLALVPDKVA